MNISQILEQITETEKTPLVTQLVETIHYQAEMIQHLKDEIARLQKRKGKPKIEPSRLGKPKGRDGDPKPGKRPGSEKKAKTRSLVIHETKVIDPVDLPAGSRLRRYEDYVVQGLKFEAYNTRYRVACWEAPDGRIFRGELPADVRGRHFSPEVITFILHQHYHSRVTQPLILEQLREAGLDISSGQINRILIEDKDRFHQEKEEILKAGLEVSDYINVDDTGARHNGKNGYCTHIGNPYFAHFESSESKSRINFLEILRAGWEDYVLDPDAIAYMADAKLPREPMDRMIQHVGRSFENESAWMRFLAEVGVTSDRHIRIATEGALIGSLMTHGFNRKLIIVSDDAGQFDVLLHALCWIHAERSIARLVGFNDLQRDKPSAPQSGRTTRN